ncbi:hypothetical protein B0T16DRAFT_419678 [Cercophora newfieldiana]|uniref:Uncharacterized protein n=1 Tax=Cercophora newfieldiana TaxID=92897 RepID=A0AA39XYG6_9PEZI|nr:hypothetical protein B0T16DRAFT_419678 [Cercophora newfieldiana]
MSKNYDSALLVLLESVVWWIQGRTFRSVCLIVNQKDLRRDTKRSMKMTGCFSSRRRGCRMYGVYVESSLSPQGCCASALLLF